MQVFMYKNALNEMENAMNIEETLAKELGIKVSQVTATIKLIDEGCTIPFIASGTS